MKTTITAYADLSVLDDETLNGIVDHEREAFGYEGYGEYLFCSNPACRRIQSIDEVYGISDSKSGYVPLEELEEEGPNVRDCPDCKSPSILIFNPGLIKSHLTALYRDAYGSIMRDDKGTIRGTCIIQPTTLRACFDESINYREGFNWQEFRDRTAELLKIETCDDTPVLSTNRVSINRPYRKGGAFLQLGAACGSNMTANHDQLPTFSCVRFDGNVLPLLEAIGHKQIVEDEYGTVVIGMEKFGELKRAFNLPLNQFAQKYGAAISKVKKAARSRVSPEPKPKYYRGVSLIDELQRKNERLDKGIESYDQNEISPELLKEISDTFRELYNNEYGQFAFYPSKGKPLPPREFFESDNYIPLEELDAFDLEAHIDSKTGEVPKLWHDPETVRARLDHLRLDGQLALIRNKDTAKIEAFTYGYRTSLRDAFEREEWHNPINYSGLEDTDRLRDFEAFTQYINDVITKNPEMSKWAENLSGDSPVYIWNQFGVMPSARRMGKMKEAAKCLAEDLERKKMLHGVGLLEAQKGSVAHQIFMNAGAVDVPEALKIPGEDEENDITLMVFSLRDFAKYFQLK